MEDRSPPPAEPPLHSWVPFVVLGMGLLLTLGAALYVKGTTRARDHLRLQNAVRRAEATIQARLDTYIALLRGGSGLFAAKAEVSRDDFRQYVERLDLRQRYPGIQGIGFSVRIPPGAGDSVVAALRRQGIADFELWPDVPAPERHAIVYLEPLDRRNRAALGYDMYSEPVRRRAMAQARDDAAPAVSGRVTLVQEIDEHHQAGFLIYVPVYRDHTIPVTVAERRERLLGFVYSPFRADDLFRGIFAGPRERQVDFRLYDDTLFVPERLLHDSRRFHPPAAEPLKRPSYETRSTMQIAGRLWGLEFTTRPPFDRDSGRDRVPIILVGGLLVSGVLFGLTRAQVRARHQAARITADLLRSERAMRQTQKLESIGLLAGGIAHDFNNLLTGILGNATLALQTVPAGHPLRPLLDDVIAASQRAAELTGQLLAYAGKGRFYVRPVDVCELIRGLTALLRSSISKKVQLELDLGTDCGWVEADPAQLQQLLMNLVINGAEAIGDAPGSVRVTVRNRQLTPDDAREFDEFDLAPGSYLEVRVADTGSGMDETTRRQIFDPFFTTKFMGRGLGLAAAQGIVRGHKGAIAVESAPGAGSAFLVLLPRSGNAGPAATTAAAPGGADGAGAAPERELRQRGTILVVEDEEVVLRTDRIALTRGGYEVVAAPDGGAALRLFEPMADRISLVLLDLTLPVMGGEEVMVHLRRMRPEVPVVITSGYSESEVVTRLAGAHIDAFLQKPYGAETLLEVVERVLDEHGRR